MSRADSRSRSLLAVPVLPVATLAVLLAGAIGSAWSAPLAPAGGDGAPGPVFSDPLASTNLWAPFVPGALKVFKGSDEGDKVVVAHVYHDETRDFMLDGNPVATHLLAEVEFVDGVLAEISLNYFAEADDGAVYYFGETVDNYEDGQISDHEGSWLVGGPTLPGDPPETAVATEPALFFPADPQVGDQWKPEDLLPFVDETVTLIKADVTIKTPAGKFEGGLQTEETSALDTGSEKKWYAPGVGVVLEKGKGEKVILIASTLVPVEPGP